MKHMLGLLLLLAGCTTLQQDSAPTIVEAEEAKPSVVESIRTVFKRDPLEIDPKLLVDCHKTARQPYDDGKALDEAIRIVNARGDDIDECTGRIRKIKKAIEDYNK